MIILFLGLSRWVDSNRLVFHHSHRLMSFRCITVHTCEFISGKLFIWKAANFIFIQWKFGSSSIVVFYSKKSFKNWINCKNDTRMKIYIVCVLAPICHSSSSFLNCLFRLWPFKWLCCLPLLPPISWSTIISFVVDLNLVTDLMNYGWKLSFAPCNLFLSFLKFWYHDFISFK